MIVQLCFITKAPNGTLSHKPRVLSALKDRLRTLLHRDYELYQFAKEVNEKRYRFLMEHRTDAMNSVRTTTARDTMCKDQRYQMGDSELKSSRSYRRAKRRREKRLRQQR